MAPDYRTYLTTEILSEKRTLSYRNVARALKVHVNAAKCMLYDYYETENKKRPESLYATYLLAGVKRRPQGAATTNGKVNGHIRDEDEPMPSSPPPFTSSVMDPSQDSHPGSPDVPPVPVKTIILVREEDLEGRIHIVQCAARLTWVRGQGTVREDHIDTPIQSLTRPIARSCDADRYRTRALR